MSPETSSHSTQLTKCTPCTLFLFLLPLLSASVMTSPPPPPHHTPTSAKAPFLRLSKYFTCGRRGRVAGPRAPQMRGDRESSAGAHGFAVYMALFPSICVLFFCCKPNAAALCIYYRTCCCINIHYHWWDPKL